MDENQIKENTRLLKRRFFAMRNGMTGEQMRRAGADYRINFGLNLPQIVDIAREFPVDADFAESLWHNTSTRESMLIAPMLYPRELMDAATARRWVEESPTVEVTDILCYRLLRHLPCAPQLGRDLLAEEVEEPLVRYAGLRLLRNMMTEDNARELLPIARAEAVSGRPTAMTAAMLVADIEMLLDEDEDGDD